MKRKNEDRDSPEIAAYTKYYEHDGMLRAYANRAMLLAMLFGVVALGSLAFAVYIRIQPPTVIRVDKDGDATVVGTRNRTDPVSRLALALSADAGPNGISENPAAPTDMEARAVLRTFLQHYLTYTPDSVTRDLAESLNMMTTNLRKLTRSEEHTSELQS